MPRDRVLAGLAVSAGALLFGGALSGMASIEGDLASASVAAPLPSHPAVRFASRDSGPRHSCHEVDFAPGHAATRQL